MILRAILLLLSLSIPAWALDITTTDGTVYKSAEVSSVDPDGITVTYSDGVAKIPFADLPADLQKQYTPPVAAASPVQQAPAMTPQPMASATPEKVVPQVFPTHDNFSLHLTSAWRQVPDEILKQLDEKMGELAHSPQNWQYAYQLKDAPHWLAYPYILVQFIPGRESEADFEKEVESREGVQKGLDDATQKASSILSGTRVDDSSYDDKTLTGEFLMESNVSGIGALEGFTALKLTQTGTIQFCGYCTKADKGKMVPFFRTVANNIEVAADSAYKPDVTDSIPVLGNIDWSAAVFGGVIGLAVGLLGRKFLNKPEPPKQR